MPTQQSNKAPERFTNRQKNILFGCGLILITLAAYWPCLRGGFVWDDDSWTTGVSDLMSSFSGLRRMWSDWTALQQYYPLAGTSFWIDHQLWGYWTLPYHIENVLLHSAAALLFWRLLWKLEVPGAWLAAAVFAIHPVMVESAGWITERKNVLAMVFYLGTLLAYGRFASFWKETKINQERNRWWYALAFCLLCCAMLSKTTAFSLPPVILLLTWWKQGRIRWGRDVLPTLPLFIVAIGFSGMTAWLEKNHVGAKGPEFNIGLAERFIIAGHAFWFYLGKLFWPANLCSAYPRWQIDRAAIGQWLYPVSAVGLLFSLWYLRNRIGRGPATAAFFFVGTLFPVLGFLNAYYMRYSFVCDHWVYLSSLGIIALTTAVAVNAGIRHECLTPASSVAVCVCILLAGLTWKRAGDYVDMETLWRTSISRNPNSWLAQNNLGYELLGQNRVDEAIVQFKKAIQIWPDYPEAHNNLGIALVRKDRVDEGIVEIQKGETLDPDLVDAHNNLGLALLKIGRMDEAVAQFQQALTLNPGLAESHFNLANALMQKGQNNEAISEFEKALTLQPDYPQTDINLGSILLQAGRLDEAIVHFQKAVVVRPDIVDVHYDLGTALFRKGRMDEAIIQFQQALALQPDNAQANNNLALALLQKGDVDGAITYLQKTLVIKPDYAEACNNLGFALVRKGRDVEAIGQFQKALALQPGFIQARIGLTGIAWRMATSPDVSVRNGAKAVEVAGKLNQLSGGTDPESEAVLAAAYAEAGQFPEAVATAQHALQLATSQKNPEWVAALQSQLKSYEAGQPYRDAGATQ